jgi:hypothetical protein
MSFELHTVLFLTDKQLMHTNIPALIFYVMINIDMCEFYWRELNMYITLRKI